MKIITHKLTWIDIINPTKKDLEFIRRQYRFHPIILDELMHTSARSRVELYEKYLFMTYHLPIYDKEIKSSRKGEIDFLITKDKVITVHYEDMEPLNNFLRRLNNDPNFKDRALGGNTGRLVYYIIEEIFLLSQRQLLHIEENESRLAKNLFKGKESQLLKEISYLKRDILDYSIISKPQEIILESLKEVGAKFWGGQMRIYLSDLAGDYLKIIQILENFKETITALEETNSQLLSAKTNAVMQRFTVLAFLTFPMILFTSLFNVSILQKYFGENLLVFSAVSLSVLGLTVLMLIFFRKKGWL